MNTLLVLLTVLGLRTEYLPNPEGIEATQPRLQWQLASTQRGQKQTAYRILVASSAEALARDDGDFWDSGKVMSDATSQIAYAGKPLNSGQRCFWKVQAWDKDGNASAWSEPAKWSMGLLKSEDWKAQWISFKDESPLHTERQKLHLPPARHYRKDFDAPRSVKRATLYFSALGIAEMQLNGTRVGEAWFESGWADYARRAYYRTHDVTALVKQGQNRIGAIVADGWYAGYVGYGMLVGYGPGKTGRNIYGKTPALLAQLNIEYNDGTHEIVGTDATWQTSGDGPIREADMLMGESYDARRTDEQTWKWEAAIPAEANGSTKAKFFEPGINREIDLGFQKPPKLVAYTAPPIRVVEELAAQRITEPKPGTYIFDLGQNIAGVVRLKIKGPAGTVVQLRHGEMLHQDGRLMTENLRKARATDFYTLRGDPAGETWQPQFTYHGFQFVELTGLPEKPALDAITGLVLSNDTPATGEFACSDPVMTQFWRNTVRTQRANFLEIPTDCPQRDERLGWMGDAQIYVRTASYNADVSAFFTKWLDDVEEAQRDSGAYPDYAPYPFAHGKPGATHGTAWTDAGVICPWTIWQVYGDTRVLERHWGSMTKFMAWRSKSDPELKGVSLGNTWGDWLNLNEATPIEYVDLCYHFTSARLMAQMAGALGKHAEAADFTARMAKLAANFKSQFLKPDAR
jgi:alpha-L-rhamnosidase